MKHTLKGNANREVWLDGEWLDPKPSQEIRNHSPDGFNWGYGGSGPAQLALAVVLKLTGKPDGYQEFKWNVIAKIPQGDFACSGFEIEFELEDWKEWAKNQRAEVYELANAYSGSFVRALVDAFCRADSENTEKLLNAFPEYFEKLYQVHLTVLGGKE